MQTVGESPMAEKMPPRMQDTILHASLTKDAFVLMGSDMVGEQGLIQGNAVSLMLNCSSEAEIRTLFTVLSAGGRANHELEHTFWGAIFGDLTDRFGNHWLLHFDQHASAT